MKPPVAQKVTQPTRHPTASTSIRKMTLLSVALLGLIVLAIFAPVLFTNRDLVPGARETDLSFLFIPVRRFGFTELAHGNFPLWNPYLFSGVPFFGGFTAALLYPPNLIFVVLPIAKAVSWSVALHVFLGGLFTFYWARKRQLHPAAAFIAGVTVMFCGAHFLHVYAGHLTHLCTIIWAPLIFTAIDGSYEEPRNLRWPLLGMFAVAMQIFAGYPQYVYFTALIAMTYASCCAVKCEARWRFLTGVVSIYAGAALLGGVQLFTAIDDWRDMSRATGISYENAANFSLPPENLITAFAPGFFGDVMRSTYWGRLYLWETSMFIGAAALCLAALGAASDKMTRRFSLIMIGVSLLLALGGRTPIYKLLYEILPGLSRFRGPVKFALPASLFIAMLAAIGFDRLLREQRLSRRLVIVAAALAGLLAVGAAICYTSGPIWRAILTAVANTHEFYHGTEAYYSPIFIAQSARAASIALLIATVVLGAAALLFYWHRRAASTVPLFLLVALSTVEQAWVARSVFPYFSVTANSSPALKRVAQSDQGDYRVLHLYSTDEAMNVGAREIWGYDAAIPSRYAHVMALTQSVNPDIFPSDLEVSRITSPLLKMLRCKYAISNQTVLTTTGALPHLLLVPNYRVIPQRDDMFATLLQPEFNPRTDVLLESVPTRFSLPPTFGPASPESPSAGTVILENETTDTLTISADLRSSAVLLVTDTYARSWRVTPLEPSGQKYEVMPANHCLRAVPLEAGHHRFRMEYVPLGFQIGKWVSATAATIYLACVVWCLAPGLRRRS